MGTKQRRKKFCHKADDMMFAHAEYLCSLGPALIYKLPPNMFMPFSTPDYYWKYQEGATVYGPFKTIEETKTHISATLVASGRAEEQVKDTLIFVDFKNKRRIK